METAIRVRAPERLPCDRCGRPSVRLVREDLGLCARHLVMVAGPSRVCLPMAARVATPSAT